MSRNRQPKNGDPDDDGLFRWSRDHFGSREAGAEAALAAEGDLYKLGFGMAVGYLVERDGFSELVSTEVTDLAGLPAGSPGHRSGTVAALMPLSAKAYGLIALGHRRSKDPRHKHVLTVWGIPGSGSNGQKRGVKVTLDL